MGSRSFADSKLSLPERSPRPSGVGGSKHTRLAMAIGLAMSAGHAAQAQDVDLANLGSGGFQMPGLVANDFTGYSVSGAGDVNGDGLADLIVGASGADPGGDSAAGVAYVVFGRSGTADVDFSNLATGGFVIEGANASDLAGISVSGAGDVNGDGLDDLVVGAFFASPGGRSASGAGYVVFGKADNATVDLASLGSGGFLIEGAVASDQLGTSVSGAGDVNGDGLADVLFGAPNAEPQSRSGAGAGYVVFGKSTDTTVDLTSLGSAGFVIEGVAVEGGLGESVSGAGDVNGDGLSDVVLGARLSNPGGRAYAGTGYVVFGKANTAAVDLASLGSGGFVVEGAVAGDHLGTSVAGAGDVNGDGLADVIVGAPAAAATAGSEAGMSYLVFGKADSATVAVGSLGVGGFVIEGGAAGDYSGTSVAGAGDVNGDGLADLLVGADEADPNGRALAGASYVIFGKSSTDPVDVSNLADGGYLIAGAAAGDESGFSVSSAGDVNGDGLADVVVGAWRARPGAAVQSGTAYVVFSSQFPGAIAPFRTFVRNGDAPRSAVGTSGDGSNAGTPDSAVWADFDDGGEFAGDASLLDVTITRSSGSFAGAAADVHWQLQSSRIDWSGAELVFRYTDGQLLTSDEAALQIVAAPGPSGPYTILPSVVNPDDNTLSVVVDQLGYFFITEALGEIEVSGNGVTIVDGDATPSDSDDTDFGDVVVGQLAARTFTIRNTGLGTLTIAGPVTVTGAGFSVVQPAGGMLMPNDEVTFEVRFQPFSAENFAGLVSVPSSDDDEDPFTFVVRASGVAQAVAEIAVSGNGTELSDGDTEPSELDGTDFGAVIIGESVTRTFVIRNDGAGDLDLTDAVTVVGSGFSVVQPASTALAPAATTAIEVTFAPTQSGIVDGLVLIPNSDPDEDPFTFAVGGVGVPDTDLIFANDFE